MPCYWTGYYRRVIAVCLILILSFFAIIPVAYCAYTGINGKDEFPDIDLPELWLGWDIIIPPESFPSLWHVHWKAGVDLAIPFEWLINEGVETMFDVVIYYPMSGLKWIFDSITNILLSLGIASPLAVSLATAIMAIVALVIVAVAIKVLDIIL